ncbi:tyrosine/nicotianamine aminotransferase, pyridoxal phosphate-dependent transferase, partial [Tanacetum coccineum]
LQVALVEAIQSAQFNCYAPSVGINLARRAVADYLSRNIPYKLTTNDVFLTVGAEHAIHVLLTVLDFPGANILLPRPNYPTYEARARFSSLEVRHFDLLPEKGWEVDTDHVKAMADDKTVAIVLINPGNPCGNVFTYEHLKKIAEMARELGILVISDEVYAHQIADSIKSCLMIAGEPPTVIQGAVPHILENTPDSFFMNINKLLKEGANMVFERLKEIPFVACPHKPEGSMFAMVKLNLSTLNDIVDDTDFCMKLAKEESMILLPGNAVGMKNWVRMRFAAEPTVLKDAIVRMKAFCLRHAKY